MQIILLNEDEMLCYAASLAKKCRPPFWIYLSGELGAGKTTFVRGFLKGLGVEGLVKSPTYTIVEPYMTPNGPAYHFDLYRLEDPAALEYIGVRDYFADREAFGLIEWPIRAVGCLPQCQIEIVIDIEFLVGGRQLTLFSSDKKGKAVLDQMSLTA